MIPAIHAFEVLEGKGTGRQICLTLQAKFPPEYAAEGYRELATHADPNEPSELTPPLETAEELALQVTSPRERLRCIQRIYQTRSAFLGEADALRAAERLTEPLDRGFAWLGTAEGLPVVP